MLTLSALLALSAGAQAQLDPNLLDPSRADPELPQQVVNRVFPARLVEVWLAALKQPEVDLQRQTVEAFVQAHQEGLPDVPATVGPHVLATLKQPQTHPALLAAAITAALKLDLRDAAPALLALNEQGTVDLTLATDAVLTQWRHAPAGKIWLARLRDANTRLSIRRSAAQGLAALGDAQAAPALKALALDQHVDPTLRLTAARAAGELLTTGLLADAQQLLKDASAEMTDRLVAVALIQRHGDAASQAQLVKLTEDADPALAGAAVEALGGVNPPALLPAMPKLLARTDIGLRAQATAALVKIPDPAAIELLAQQLGDVLTATRLQAAGELLRRGQDANGPVCAAALKQLQGDNWRAQEQAALLLGQLGHQPAIARLTALHAPDTRPEVRLACTLALRLLQAKAALPALLAWTEQLLGAKPAAFDAQALYGRELAQLFFTFGTLDPAPARSAALKLVPKNSGYSAAARAAAIWMLGKAQAGVEDKELVRLLSQRLSDQNIMEPEMTEVRIASAVALGRMQSKSTVNVLKRFADLPGGPTLEMPSEPPLLAACRWAINHITGETMPALPEVEDRRAGWFLEPVE